MRVRWIAHVEKYANHPSAPYLLSAIAFADASFLPLVPDVLFVPMALLQPKQLWRLTILCTVAATVGALVGYGIGALAWDHIGAHLVGIYGGMAKFQAFQDMFAKWGVWIIIFKALTPIPFKFAAIAAGVAHMNVLLFCLATLISRGLHFALIAVLIKWFGPRFVEITRKYESRAAAAVAVVAVVGGLVYLGLRD
ncbi:MAG TPA: YqaA family protein [Alphaproteobacteria bacterium]